MIDDGLGRRVVVDPCVGNDKSRSLPFWHMQRYTFLDDLGRRRVRSRDGRPRRAHAPARRPRRLGHPPRRRHLGADVPNARHLYTQRELDFRRSNDVPDVEDVFGDSIAPIFEAGLADIVAEDEDLGDGLRLAPTPGHTPDTRRCGSSRPASAPSSPAISSTTPCNARDRTGRKPPTRMSSSLAARGIVPERRRTRAGAHVRHPLPDEPRRSRRPVRGHVALRALPRARRLTEAGPPQLSLVVRLPGRSHDVGAARFSRVGARYRHTHASSGGRDRESARRTPAQHREVVRRL